MSRNKICYIEKSMRQTIKQSKLKKENMMIWFNHKENRDKK
jgi:hypothetical protein